MAGLGTPVVRLFAPSELPVRISDWPEGVGVALCCVEGRVVNVLPYHLSERPMSLRQRLTREADERLRGFAVHPPLKGIPEARLSALDDQRLRAELEQTLRSMPRLIEEVNDFAINYEFAAAEGLTLDALDDVKGKPAAAPLKGAAVTDQIPVGYLPYNGESIDSELIAGALLKPAGAAGIDLVLVHQPASRAIPPEVMVMVREDSLRIAVPLGPVLMDGRLPPVLRLPAGSLMLGNTGGRPVPAMVLRRGGMLFVAPDHAAVATQASGVAMPSGGRSGGLFKWAALGLGAAALLAAVVFGVWMVLQGLQKPVVVAAPVDSLRSSLFAPPELAPAP